MRILSASSSIGVEISPNSFITSARSQQLNRNKPNFVNAMSGTDHRQELITDGPVVILVNPQLGENIGTAIRAMANFGLHELRLVDPRDGWPSEAATAAAAGANHVLAATQVFDRLAEAMGDLSFAYATTARHRDMLKPVRGPGEAMANLRARHRRGEKTAILFGRERAGLTNEEIALADEIVTFRVNPAFASLNIAQAVLLMSYEWLRSGEGALPFDTPESVPASRHELFGLFEHLEAALDREKYFYPEIKRANMVENLRNIFHKAALSQQEIHALRGVVAALEGRERRAPRKRR